MPYRIELTRQAARALESMPANVRVLLIIKIGVRGDVYR